MTFVIFCNELVLQTCPQLTYFLDSITFIIVLICIQLMASYRIFLSWCLLGSENHNLVWSASKQILSLFSKLIAKTREFSVLLFHCLVWEIRFEPNACLCRETYCIQCISKNLTVYFFEINWRQREIFLSKLLRILSSR